MQTAEAQQSSISFRFFALPKGLRVRLYNMRLSPLYVPQANRMQGKCLGSRIGVHLLEGTATCWEDEVPHCN